MLSRTANSIYWACRYIERAENIARFVKVNWHLQLEANQSVQGLQWAPLVNITGDQEYFLERYGEANRDNVLQFLTFDREYANSIWSCLRMARENARSIRELISSEMWEQINQFYHMVDEAAGKRLPLEDPHDFFNAVVRESMHFIGLSLATMTHDEGWHFCRVGRMLERADKTSRILDVKYFYLLPSPEDVGGAIDHVQWSALLRSASALQPYRLRHRLVEPDRVVELLLLDHEFPRAVRYCIKGALESLHAISGTPVGMYSNEAERRCGQLAASLAYARVSDVIRGGLHEFLDELQQSLNQIGDAMFASFFAGPAAAEE